MIVRLITINVMDSFVGCKAPPDVRLHYETVLHNVALAVGVRVLRHPASPILAARAVSDEATPQGLTRLRRNSTSNRAEFSQPPAGARQVRSTPSAMIGRGLTPARFQVAGPGAEACGVLSPVLRAKQGIAGRAFQIDCPVFHARNIARQERYCEIAAKRLSQEVLPLTADRSPDHGR